MPNRKNFSEVTDIKLLEVNPKGWVNPLFVEYGLGMHFSTPSYFWRVKQTDHTFVIPINRMEFLSSGNYKEHFEKALEGFREEYMEWKEKGFNLDWMMEYKEIFGKFIF